MPSDPFLTTLFPPGGTDPNAPGTLYGKATTLFRRGSYVPNPTSDPGTGTSLATWWKSAWDTWRSKVPARSSLPGAAGTYDKTSVDNMASEIFDALKDMEGEKSTGRATGHANLIQGKFMLLQSMLPFDVFEAVPTLAAETAGLRDASFSASRAVIAQALNHDRPGEPVAVTYRNLQLAEAGSLHYSIGGDPPGSFEMNEGETPGNYLHWAHTGLEVPVPNQPRADLGNELATQLMVMEQTKAEVRTLFALPQRTLKDEAKLQDNRKKLGACIESIANLSRTFSVETWDLAKKGEGVSARAELAMVAAEAMRDVTGASRTNAKQPGPSRSGVPTTNEINERADAGRAAERILVEAPDREPDPEFKSS